MIERDAMVIQERALDEWRRALTVTVNDNRAWDRLAVDYARLREAYIGTRTDAILDEPAAASSEGAVVARYVMRVDPDVQRLDAKSRLCTDAADLARRRPTRDATAIADAAAAFPADTRPLLHEFHDAIARSSETVENENDAERAFDSPDAFADLTIADALSLALTDAAVIETVDPTVVFDTYAAVVERMHVNPLTRAGEEHAVQSLTTALDRMGRAATRVGSERHAAEAGFAHNSARVLRLDHAATLDLSVART